MSSHSVDRSSGAGDSEPGGPDTVDVLDKKDNGLWKEFTERMGIILKSHERNITEEQYNYDETTTKIEKHIEYYVSLYQ